MVSFTYIFSFIFKSEDKGQTCVLLINLLIGTLGGTAVLIMRLDNELTEKGRIMAYIFRIIPSFSFCYAYNLLLYEDNLKYSILFFNSILDLEYIKSDFIYLGVESVLYL